MNESSRANRLFFSMNDLALSNIVFTLFLSKLAAQDQTNVALICQGFRIIVDFYSFNLHGMKRSFLAKLRLAGVGGRIPIASGSLAFKEGDPALPSLRDS